MRLPAILLLIAGSSLGFGQDTLTLSRLLSPHRQGDRVPSGAFHPITDSLILWADSRIRAGASADELNAELSSSGLFRPAEAGNPDAYQAFLGYLGQVTEEEIAQTDLIRFTLQIGKPCGYHEIALIYDHDRTRQLAAVREGGGSYTPIEIVSSAASPIEGTSDILLSFGSTAQWCSSTLTSSYMWVARISGDSAKILLDERVYSRRSFRDGPDIEPSIVGKTVTFEYISESKDSGLIVRPYLRRYRLEGDQLIREALVAPTLIGIVDEWLLLSGDEARAVSSPQAMKSLEELKDWKEFSFAGNSYCSDGLLEWQVRVRTDVTGEERTVVVTRRPDGTFYIFQVVETPDRICPEITLHSKTEE